MTFLDNHDQDRRFGDTGRTRRPDQITLGLALIFTIQGIPCVYYGTEQGLTGHKTKTQMDDSIVREALWGKRGAFDSSAALYQNIAALSALRRAHPALRGGGQFFRPVSGDGTNFGLSRTPAGVLAYSRLLGKNEVWNQNPVGTAWQVLWSNQPNAPMPGIVTERSADLPLRVLPMTLRPGEVQILARV